MITTFSDKCSLYKPYFYKGNWQMSVKPELVTIGDMLFKPWQSELLSFIKSETDENKRKILKRQLWAITPSSISKDGRGVSAVVEHTGLLAFDIDKYNGQPISESTLQDMTRVIKKIPYTLYCGRSASGRGLWGMFRISDTDKHSLHFNAMSAAFKQIGIALDPAPSSIASLRFVSYDQDAYYNENASVFDKVVEPLKVVRKPLTINSDNTGDNSDGKALIEKFNSECTANQIHDILTNYGFNFHSVKGEQFRFTRPGRKGFFTNGQFIAGGNKKTIVIDRDGFQVNSGKRTVSGEYDVPINGTNQFIQRITVENGLIVGSDRLNTSNMPPAKAITVDALTTLPLDNSNDTGYVPDNGLRDVIIGTASI
jgi:hypothetical protein